MRDRIPNLEYVFCDTEKELPETYDYLEKLEVYLGRKIVILKNDLSGFDELLIARRGFLPSPQVRWCTEYLKIKPFEKYVGNHVCHSYIGIRADEPHRKGYISTKPNIHPQYPFIEDGLRKADIIRLLEDSGLGLPAYYDWRSRSGCYFCFFQQRIEWVGLYENHPDLFMKAIEYEKVNGDLSERYTWSKRESLRELMDPNRIAQIKAEHDNLIEILEKKHKANLTLGQIFIENGSEDSCLICHL